MKNLIHLTLILCLLTLSYSCQEGDQSLESNETGKLRIIATDAPFDIGEVTSAAITINEMKVKNSQGEIIPVMSEEMTLDLVNLRNGVVRTLSELEVPVGEYQEVILMIQEASIEVNNVTDPELNVPSGAQSGLKISISPPISVKTNISTDLLLDFDLARSFVARGNDLSKFNFKPVIRATNLTVSGSLSGEVQNESGAVVGAVVILNKGESTEASAVTDVNGFYKIIGLQPGSYTVSASAENMAESSPVTVEIESGNEAQKDLSLQTIP